MSYKGDTLNSIKSEQLSEQVHINITKPLYRLFRPITMWASNDEYRPFGKPAGGLWTSSVIDNEQGYSTGWIEWCNAERYLETQLDSWWTMTPFDDELLVLIENKADIERLLEQYPFKAYPRSEPEVDYCAVLRDGFAGVHLTEGGLRATRFMPGTVTYGWDCESTIWLRWTFEDIRLVYKPEHRRKKDSE